MKCTLHEDQPVIMVCQTQQCQTSLVCVLCIAGQHKGHDMATLEDVGKTSKKGVEDEVKDNLKFLEDQKEKMAQLNDMELAIKTDQSETHKTIKEQGQQMHETVDKVVDRMISECDVRYDERLKELRGIKERIKEAIAKVNASQETSERILGTEDWSQIIQHKKKSITTPKTEDLPKNTTPSIGGEEINKVLMTGILSALKQCEPTSVNTTVEEHTSDFIGTVYRHKSLKSVFSVLLARDNSITCIAAPDNDGAIWVIINKEIKFCHKRTIVEKNIEYKKKVRGIAITDHHLLATCTEEKCVKKITFGGKVLHTFHTRPLIPNQICVASNGDILVTLVSSFADPIPDTQGVVSRYTPQGKRMITFERDRFGNTICPKYVAASRISDMVVITTHTNSDNDGWFYGHVIVMTGDLQVKFRYLSDGRVIPADQQYQPDISTKHFLVSIGSNDNIILGDIISGSIEIIDKGGHKLQSLVQVERISSLTISSEDKLCVGTSSGKLEVFKYT